MKDAPVSLKIFFIIDLFQGYGKNSKKRKI